MTASKLFPHRISVVTGHYGTGKTEFAVNLAMSLAHETQRVMLADLDLVNPYFCSRERKSELQEIGVKLIASPQSCFDADAPALPAEFNSIIEDKSVRGILDIGGDPIGARVIAGYQEKISAEDYQMIYVLNANRPDISTPDAAIQYLRNIESVTGLTCTGFVNNTHLCGDTTIDDIYKGAELAAEVSKITKIPIICHVVEHRLAAYVQNFREPVFPITIKMTKPWEA